MRVGVIGHNAMALAAALSLAATQGEVVVVDDTKNRGPLIEREVSPYGRGKPPRGKKKSKHARKMQEAARRAATKN